MVRPRSIFAGDTDYTGVDLSDVVAHIEQWRDALVADVEGLGNIRARLQAHGDASGVRDGLSHIDHFRDLFTRYRGDLARLAEELPLGVRSRHVEIASQLYQSLTSEDHTCVVFKQRHYLDALSESDEVQNILAEVYRLSRDTIIDLGDVGSIVPRLKTYLDAPDAGSIAPCVRIVVA
jgi:hypothetical protein